MYISNKILASMAFLWVGREKSLSAPKIVSKKLILSHTYDADRSPNIPSAVGASEFVISVLVNRSFYSSVCTGSLIAPNVVITSAGCLMGLGSKAIDASNVSIEVTTKRDNKSSSSVFKAVKTISHPKYNKFTFENDIALVILETEISPSVAGVTKIFTGGLSSDVAVQVAGYKYSTVPGDESIPTTLEFAGIDTATSSSSDCRNANHRWTGKSHSSICVTNIQNNDAYYSYAGAALFVSDSNSNLKSLVGILNSVYSHKPNLLKNPLSFDSGSDPEILYYTNLKIFLGWIVKQTNITEYQPVSTSIRVMSHQKALSQRDSFEFRKGIGGIKGAIKGGGSSGSSKGNSSPVNGTPIIAGGGAGSAGKNQRSSSSKWLPSLFTSSTSFVELVATIILLVFI